MRHLICITVLALSYLATAGATNDQGDRQTAEMLWEQAVAAKGGRERLAAIRNFAIREKPPPGDTKRAYEIDDYHEINGIRVPRRVMFGRDPTEVRVEINPDYEPSIFPRLHRPTRRWIRGARRIENVLARRHPCCRRRLDLHGLVPADRSEVQEQQ